MTDHQDEIPGSPWEDYQRLAEEHPGPRLGSLGDVPPDPEPDEDLEEKKLKML